MRNFLKRSTEKRLLLKKYGSFKKKMWISPLLIKRSKKNGKNAKKLSDVWDMSSSLADIYGITGFMYGCAVSTLSSVWKYGKELRVKYNSKFNYNGEGVVNPAILTLS